MNRIVFVFLVFILLSSCNGSSDVDNYGTSAAPPPPTISATIINSYPHDPQSFTQGLAFYNGQLFESTGSPETTPNNGSWVGTVDIATGKILKRGILDKKYFGEGITILNDKIYQLTWQTKTGFVYDAKTFKKLKEFTYKTEGWGLANDGTSIILSDGTSNLYFIHPDSFTVTKILGVLDNSGPVPNINELEYINGYLYANQWGTGYILKIDPATGKVVGRIDLSNLVAQVRNKSSDAEFLNGIAYDSTSNKLFITGKKWPELFELKLL